MSSFSLTSSASPAMNHLRFNEPPSPVFASSSSSSVDASSFLLSDSAESLNGVSSATINPPPVSAVQPGIADAKSDFTENFGSQFSLLAEEKVLPGYAAIRSVNITAVIHQRCLSPTISLGCFAKVGRFTVICTQGTSTHHFLISIDCEKLLNSSIVQDTRNYIIGICEAERYVEMKAMASRTLVCATTDGKVHLFKVTEDGQLKFSGSVGLLKSTIRDMAVRGNQLAAGGFDHVLSISDMEKLTTTMTAAHNDVVGSVKWNDANLVSATLDGGRVLYYDLRQKSLQLVFDIHTQKAKLFAHEPVANDRVLVGYGDGELAHFDLRVGKKLQIIADPFVDGIGGITFNSSQDSFVVSGYQDFTVWKFPTKGVSASPFSHGVLRDESMASSWGEDESFSTSAAFYNDSSVLVSTTSNKLEFSLYIM